MIEWNVVKIDQTSGKNVPFVSIGRGQMDFNAAACKLINDEGQYKFAKVFTGKENGKTVVAVRFLCEAELDTIAIKRKNHDGKIIQGMTLANKGLIMKLFGKDGTNEGMNRRKVELLQDDMLKILDD